MKTVPPGTYEVRAILEGDRRPLWSWNGRIESAPFTLSVLASEDSKTRDQLDMDRLIASAEFYLLTHRWDEARRLAEELTLREPTNVGAWVLLGDALDGEGKPQQALNVYQRALAVSPRTYEEPSLLYERLETVLRKISR
jgi:tetratricopeptide (TPR) repeat protein